MKDAGKAAFGWNRWVLYIQALILSTQKRALLNCKGYNK